MIKFGNEMFLLYSVVDNERNKNCRTKMDSIEIADKIYNHYCTQLSNNSITTNKVEEYYVDEDKFNECIKDIQLRLKVKLRNRGFASNILIHQLAMHLCQCGEKFNNKVQESEGRIENIKFYDPSEILDLMEKIELGFDTKKPFSHQPLKGLFKIHHGSYSGIGYSLLRNIKEYWFTPQGKIIKKREKAFVNIIVNLGTQSISAIANQMHTKAIMYKESGGNLNGEWLIFAKHNQQNYFLCLASHEEGDDYIYKNKIEPCYQEFPELKSTFNNI